jgi:L-alanine-DL-glutamate epimerase-like enolase superfamily enzyme
MGPATLGRQATTEALIRGMLKGYDPDEIVERLLQDAPPGGYKNRYKKGGLAHAAVIA